MYISVYIYLCVWKCVCICEWGCVCVSWHLRVPCMRVEARWQLWTWVLAFHRVWHRLSCSQLCTSAWSACEILHIPTSTSVLVQEHWSSSPALPHPVVCGFCPSNAGSRTCVASPWPVELSSRPKKQSFLKKSLWFPKPCKSKSNMKDVSLYITYNTQAKNFRQCENMLNKGIKLLAKQWWCIQLIPALRR